MGRRPVAVSAPWLTIGALLAGFGLLAWAADRFVEGAAALAGALRVRPLAVGLVVVGFGTSAPELLVSAMAAWNGHPHTAIGNALGSNIANIALVLGVAAVVAPLSVASGVLRRELPMALGAALLALLLLADGTLGRADGAALLAAFFGLMGWMVRQAARARPEAEPLADQFAARLPGAMPIRRALAWTGAGLVLLLAASRLLVWSAEQLTRALGISDLVIGLGVLAVGTSLPELAAAVAAARKGRHGIALGNVVGSNLFNILAVVGAAGLIHPAALPPEALWRDFPVMLALTLALFVTAYGFGRPGRITRAEGALLLAAFGGYLALLARTAA